MPDINNMTPEEMKKMYEKMMAKENAGLTPEEIAKKNKEREEKTKKNIKILDETMKICKDQSYKKAGKTVSLKLDSSKMKEAKVYLPDDIKNMSEDTGRGTLCKFSCENTDALSLAKKRTDERKEKKDNNILILNMASATTPGGGTRKGMNGQEEDLCKKSTLLMSLESDAAKSYYSYNNDQNTHLGSDAVIISPHVVVFRDEKEELLDDPFEVSVITCAAPNIRFGYEGKTEDEYKDMFYRRIEGMLKCAISLGYDELILGAFGCGAFKNDASFVSDAFYKVLSGPLGCAICHADFAVLCTPGKEYNYNEFCRNFGKN